MAVDSEEVDADGNDHNDEDAGDYDIYPTDHRQLLYIITMKIS